MRGGFSSAAIKPQNNENTHQQDTTSAIQPLAHQRAGSQSPAGDPIAFDYHPTPLLWKRPKRWTAGSDTFGTSPCVCVRRPSCLLPGNHKDDDVVVVAVGPRPLGAFPMWHTAYACGPGPRSGCGWSP
ncbi:hypothetical protein CGCF415_v001300 [Colletotrichum fructicola]|nr:hypothetical protein CGCFRS4_v000686 [Colletotrichum fructicola]KAF4915721.1 hypothetical protein CGCF415_v001300 [Colletotrichum fructicola]KAF4942786.1 hypothetical protein CGCF245_v000146 [Colletotrichum fructicola]